MLVTNSLWYEDYTMNFMLVKMPKFFIFNNCYIKKANQVVVNLCAYHYNNDGMLIRVSSDHIPQELCKLIRKIQKKIKNFISIKFQ